MIRRLTVVFLSLWFNSSILYAQTFPENRWHQTLKHSGQIAPDNYFDGNKSPQVALYNDTGVWNAGYEHLKLFFREYGYTYATISASQILNGYLDRESPEILVMPGGESWKYLEKIGSTGANFIKNFVNNGGGYVGICAGAFYAVSDRLGGYATGPYGIGLLSGTAYDGTALKTYPFIEGMMHFNIDVQGFPASQQMVLFGGPSFRYSVAEAASKNIIVPARFQHINEPAMVLFEYGKGRVFLAGPHLEIEEELIGYSDPESDWPLLNSMMQRVTN